MFVRGCSFLEVSFPHGFGICIVPCSQSIWGLLTISQLWPSTTSQDPSRGITKNLIWKDAPQGNFIGNVTVRFTQLLTIPSIRERGRGLMSWYASLLFTTNTESMNESEEPESTKAMNISRTNFELTSTSRAFQSLRDAVPRCSLGSMGIFRQMTPWETRCPLILFLVILMFLVTPQPTLPMPPHWVEASVIA